MLGDMAGRMVRMGILERSTWTSQIPGMMALIPNIMGIQAVFMGISGDACVEYGGATQFRAARLQWANLQELLGSTMITAVA